MTNLVILIPIALFLGAVGLAAFLWSLKSGQYEDLDGAAERILFDDDDSPDDPPNNAPNNAKDGKKR
ncbi:MULTISPECIES: cbb3-type cytochrome oxidase assembly protein CcoS [unclassified Nitratireductor]|uniref:cbb3-type cytochrome oxidase assembly protein CcoS n=1 Tax=unclassified Nitratireductor TaxID=2641084 RepID=UPI0024BD72FA|nr:MULTISPECIES: cbb3-type cytochrome oxidase assembly protein CcoS [unclassified Nitratireductor]MCV0379450.1 cbb3-type cytochrome oxidase assembly protein CcoS [Nitratireductor sp.]MDJ1465763.1 cbb3-type cytochrome oxidase assembly protein CcoS [Nitratireductor sp. GZWM139]